MNRDQLSTLFPIGTKVINLGKYEAYVKGYVEHVDGSCDLLLHEKYPNGRFKRSHWAADPNKTRLA